MILCMGLVSGHSLLKIETPMNQMHGNFYSYQDIPVMVKSANSSLKKIGENDVKSKFRNIFQKDDYKNLIDDDFIVIFLACSSCLLSIYLISPAILGDIIFI